MVRIIINGAKKIYLYLNQCLVYFSNVIIVFILFWIIINVDLPLYIYMFIYFMVIEIYFIRLLINRNKSICIYMGFYNLILAYIYIILNYNYLSKHLIVYFFGFKMSLFLGFTLFFMTFFFLGFLLSSYINILQRIYMAYIFKHLFFLLNNIILKKKVLVNTILFRIESSDIKYTTEEIKIIVHSAFDKFENPGFWETWKWWLLGGTLLLIIGGIIVYMYTGDPKDISSVSSGSSGSSGGSTSSYTPKGLDLANTPLPEIGTLSNVDNTSIIGTLGSQVDLTGVAATGGATLLASKFFFKGRKFISEGLVYGKGAQGYINETQVLVSKLSDEDILLSVTNALEKLETHKLYNDFILSMVRIQPKFVGQSWLDLVNCLLSDEKVAFTIIRNHIYKENPKITREEAEDLVVGLIEANSSHSDILAMLGGKVAFNQETFIFLLYLTKIIIFFQI